MREDPARLDSLPGVRQFGLCNVKCIVDPMSPMMMRCTVNVGMQWLVNATECDAAELRRKHD